MKNSFKKYMEDVVSNLKTDDVLKQAIAYSLLNTGKLYRPQLFLAYVDNNENYFDIALSLECIHCYSLIHDDLPAMDNDDYRRGQLSLHKKYGEDIAILAGDGLQSLAFELIVNNQDINDNQKVKLVKILSNLIGVNQGMVNGQVLDINQNITNINDLMILDSQKTGCLLAACFLMGNTLNPLNKELDLYHLGLKLGIIYQFINDLEDNSNAFGKIKDNDLKQNKKTYLYNDFVNKTQVLQMLLKDVKDLLASLNLNDNVLNFINTIINKKELNVF